MFSTWDGMGWDGMGWDGMGWDGMGWDGMGWDGMGWDGMGWDGMGWDGMGWDGMGKEGKGREGGGVHRADIMSTSEGGGYLENTGDFQYIEGIWRFMWRGYHEYVEGCSVHWRDIMSASGISWVHRGKFGTLGDIMIHV